jgi:MFS family permease
MFFRHLLYGLLGVLLLPAIGGMLSTLFALLVELQTDPAHGQTLLSFLVGGGVWLMVFLFLPKPFRSYVLAHELSHALAAWLSGARVKQFRVGKEDGFVEVSHTNLFITLAPYLIPFYSVLLLAGTAVTGLFADVSPWMPFLPFALGLTGSYHLCFTVMALSAGQSDIEAYGPAGAYPVILLGNLAVLLAGLILLNPSFTPEALRLLSQNLFGNYHAVWREILFFRQ